MTEHCSSDESKTTLDGSHREQLGRSQQRNVGERWEGLDQPTALSEPLQAMPPQSSAHTATAGVRETSVLYTSGASKNEILLAGCTPTPLANYLKALGVLRLLSVRDPDVRGFWRGDRFVLRTVLDRAAIEHFF